MTDALTSTSDTFHLVLMGGTKLLLTPKQSVQVRQALLSTTPPKFIQLGDDLYAVHQIQKLVKSERPLDELRDQDQKWHLANREWQCQSGLWHPKQFKECSCEHESSYQYCFWQQLRRCELCRKMNQPVA